MLPSCPHCALDEAPIAPACCLTFPGHVHFSLLYSYHCDIVPYTFPICPSPIIPIYSSPISFLPPCFPGQGVVPVLSAYLHASILLCIPFPLQTHFPLPSSTTAPSPIIPCCMTCTCSSPSASSASSYSCVCGRWDGIGCLIPAFPFLPLARALLPLPQQGVGAFSLRAFVALYLCAYLYLLTFFLVCLVLLLLPFSLWFLPVPAWIDLFLAASYLLCWGLCYPSSGCDLGIRPCQSHAPPVAPAASSWSCLPSLTLPTPLPILPISFMPMPCTHTPLLLPSYPFPTTCLLVTLPSPASWFVCNWFFTTFFPYILPATYSFF